MSQPMFLFLIPLALTIVVAESVDETHQRRLQHHRRLDLLKLEKDPRGAHRQRLLKDHDDKLLKEGISLNPRYDELRKQHMGEDLAAAKNRRILKSVAHVVAKKDLGGETDGFWERFLMNDDGSLVSTDLPTRSPRTPRPQITPRPSQETATTARPTRAPRTPKPSMRDTETPGTEKPTRAPISSLPTVVQPTAVQPVDTEPPTETTVTDDPTRSPSTRAPRTPRPTPSPVADPVTPTQVEATPRPTRDQTADEPTSLLSPVAQLVVSQSLFGGDEFLDPGSYQTTALNWLDNSNTDGLSDARIMQRYSLACIYFATFQVSTVFTDDRFGVGNVPTWQTSTNWVTDANECEWARIACNDQGFVTIIDLFSNILTGEFPPEVVYLNSTLEILDIGNNLVTSDGALFSPFLGELTELTDLRTDRTNFISTDGIPTQIGNLKKLVYYSCEGSLYRGPLDGAAFPSDLTALTVLDIEANGYAGSTVPVEIGLLPALENFYIRASEIAGTIDYMVSMPSIFQTFVDLNPELGGKMPGALGSLSTLASFSATECSFTGTLPTEMGNLGGTVLNMFFYNNSFTGSIPTEWGSLTAMEELQIQVNDLDGQVPLEVCSLTSAALQYLSADCDNCPSTPCCTECFQ